MTIRKQRTVQVFMSGRTLLQHVIKVWNKHLLYHQNFTSKCESLCHIRHTNITAHTMRQKLVFDAGIGAVIVQQFSALRLESSVQFTAICRSIRGVIFLISELKYCTLSVNRRGWCELASNTGRSWILVWRLGAHWFRQCLLMMDCWLCHVCQLAGVDAIHRHAPGDPFQRLSDQALRHQPWTSLPESVVFQGSRWHKVQRLSRFIHNVICKLAFRSGLLLTRSSRPNCYIIRVELILPSLKLRRGFITATWQWHGVW